MMYQENYKEKKSININYEKKCPCCGKRGTIKICESLPSYYHWDGSVHSTIFALCISCRAESADAHTTEYEMGYFKDNDFSDIIDNMVIKSKNHRRNKK